MLQGPCIPSGCWGRKQVPCTGCSVEALVHLASVWSIPVSSSFGAAAKWLSGVVFIVVRCLQLASVDATFASGVPGPPSGRLETSTACMMAARALLISNLREIFHILNVSMFQLFLVKPTADPPSILSVILNVVMGPARVLVCVIISQPRTLAARRQASSPHCILRWAATFPNLVMSIQIFFCCLLGLILGIAPGPSV